jgi:hypothetical protein
MPVGAGFSAPVQTGPGAHPAFYTVGIGYFWSVKRPERGVEHPSHLAPRLKKENNYTSTPPLGLRGLFQSKIYHYLLPLHVSANSLKMNHKSGRNMWQATFFITQYIYIFVYALVGSVLSNRWNSFAHLECICGGGG